MDHNRSFHVLSPTDWTAPTLGISRGNRLNRVETDCDDVTSFVDPIHNLIAVEDKDEDCVRAFGPSLERLKDPKQLGWVVEAFPGATHTKW